jgi:uncharacterized protein
MQSSNKVIISGGTGLIGSHLAKQIAESGYKVYILSRDPKKYTSAHANIEFIKWELEQKSEFYKEFFEGAKAVINLAGASIGKRWNDDYKKVLYDSRIDTTKKLVDIIALCEKPPECLVSASGTGAYKDGGDDVIDEDYPLGNDFLANLCKDWESAALRAGEYGTRVVIARNAVVLDNEEGALPELIKPFKLFAGGWQGNGKQWFPWIHIKDIVDMYVWAMDSDIKGAINASSPNPVRNKDFCKQIAKNIHRPCWMGIPGFMLRIALGEFANSLLMSMRVIPKRPLDYGFTFKYPDLNGALTNLISK